MDILQRPNRLEPMEVVLRIASTATTDFRAPEEAFFNVVANRAWLNVQAICQFGKGEFIRH